LRALTRLAPGLFGYQIMLVAKSASGPGNDAGAGKL
jgi:hypothetical protein